MLSCKGYGSCALSRLHRCVGGDLFHVFGRRPQYLLQSFAKSFDERELDIKQHSISLAVCHSTPGTVYTISFCSCTIPGQRSLLTSSEPPPLSLTGLTTLSESLAAMQAAAADSNSKDSLLSFISLDCLLIFAFRFCFALL